MTVLTWRNLVVPTASPEAGLEFASRAFNTGMSNLNRGLESYQSQEGAAFNEAKAKNMQSFLETVKGQYQTPEAYQAAMQSGEIASKMNQFGNAFDREKGTAFMEKRLGDMRSAYTEEQAFNTAKDKAAVAPLLDKAKALYASGMFKEGDEVVKANEPLFKNFQSDIINARNDAELKGLSTQEAKNRAVISQADQSRKLQQLKIDAVTTEKAAKDQQEKLASEAIINKHYADFENQKSVVTQRIKDLAATPTFSSYPKTSDGLIDVDNLTKDQAAMWSGRLKQEKIAVPDSSQPLKQIQDTLKNSGISAAKQKEAVESLKGMLTNKTVLSTEAQAQLDSATAATAAVKEDAKKNNLFYFDPQSYTEDIAPVFSKISSELQDNDWTKEAIKKNISEWTTKGIEYVHPVTGKKTNVIVPANLLKTAYEVSKELDSFSLFHNRTDDRMEEYIKSVLENPAYAKQRQQADEIATGKSDLNLQELRNTLTNKANASNPATYLEQVAQKQRGTAVPLDEESLTTFAKKEEALKALRTANRLAAEDSVQNGKFKSLKGTEVNALGRFGSNSQVSEKDLDWYNKLLEKQNKR